MFIKQKKYIQNQFRLLKFSKSYLKFFFLKSILFFKVKKNQNQKLKFFYAFNGYVNLFCQLYLLYHIAIGYVPTHVYSNNKEKLLCYVWALGTGVRILADGTKINCYICSGCKSLKKIRLIIDKYDFSE